VFKNYKEMVNDLIKRELDFCKEIECEKNEHGQFIYESINRSSSLNLPYVLLEYRDWLIEKGIVKLIKE
jgi:hypothetical protein